MVLTFCLIPQLVFSQATLIETVEKKGKEITIPYKKYTLPNGLTIIVHEDHSDPLVHVDVTYHVGSAREEIGKSGFAHFFEHMMFQGSEHVGDEMHFKYITEAGGTLNGTTNRDRTNYFETLPKNSLELGLWLEADRMGFLLDSVTQGKFEVQRSTVKNERGQRYDNVPYGLVGETTSKNFYSYGHPYSWLTIGYIEDLNRVDVNDLKRFFMRWYGPNNATLTVGGDVNTAEVVKLAEKYFGSLKPCPAVKKAPYAKAEITADRYITMEDNIRFPMLSVTYPGVPMGHPDEPALDYLAYLLSNGKASLFYKNFEKTQKALSANMNSAGYELAGEINFSVRTYPGKNLVQMDSLLTASLNEFAKKGPSAEDMERARIYFEKNFVDRLEGVAEKVSTLASYQTFMGNANMLNEDYEAYRNVTREDIMRVYSQYLKDKPCLRVSVCPKGKTELAVAAPNYTVDASNYKQPKDQYKKLKYVKAKDNFDRSQKPMSQQMMGMPMQMYWEEQLANGVKVIGMNATETPKTHIQIILKGGHLLDGNDTAKNGLANLTAAMMNESSRMHTAEYWSNQLGKYGSTINISSGEEAIVINVECLTQFIQPTIGALMEKLMEPAFDSMEFVRVKNQLLESIANQANQPVQIANKLFAKLVFSGSVKALPEAGTVASVSKISLKDVKDFYAKYVNPYMASVVVVSDMNQGQVANYLSALTSWKINAYNLTEMPRSYLSEKSKIYLVDKEDAPQSELRAGSRSMPYDAYGSFYKATLMNYLLGGNFNSRINLNLREKNGWTYGARSSFNGTALAGSFVVSAGVKRNATDSALKEIISEVQKYKLNGISEEEAAFTRSSLMQGEALKYERPGQKLGFLRLASEYNFPPDLAMKRQEHLGGFNSNNAGKIALMSLPENMFLVVVGDKKIIKPGLEKLGYEIVELDKDGNVVGR